MTLPNHLTVCAEPLTNPASISTASPPFHRPKPMSRVSRATTDWPNQSKKYFSRKSVRSQLKLRAAVLAHDGFLRKNSQAKKTPAAANQNGGETKPCSAKAIGP